MTAADNAKRYRTRKELRDAALFNHVEPIDVAFFGVNANGEHIAIGYDKKPIPLVVRVEEAVQTVTQAVADKPQTATKLYVPDGVSPEQWAKLRANMVKSGNRDGALKEFEARAKSEPDNAKIYRRLHALVSATPDSPDWFEALPPVTES